MKLFEYKKLSLGFIFSFFLISCEDFLEVEVPDHKIVNEIVFNNDETALSAMTGIYHELVSASYSGGGSGSVTGLGGLSADGLELIKDDNFNFVEFEQNEISPANSANLSLWSSAYNMIYKSNALLEGIENSSQISEPVHSTLEGEAKFIRAFTYFYLINLYGEVPLILTTDYRYNSLATQVVQEQIYQQILLDLTDAIDLLEDEYRDDDRKHVNRSAAVALLARVYLYLENWAEAERLSGLVLDNTNTYELKEDLNQSFLANSKEAIWQISPFGGGVYTNTYEGNMFLSDPVYEVLSSRFALPEELLESYEVTDKRLGHWVGYHEGTNSYFAHKYKDYLSTETITEYSMVLRLAEQYLIRAEARVRQGNIQGATEDLNKIRERAGLNLLSDTTPLLEQEELLQLIFEERWKELFTEWGHRWLDLKRTGIASEVLSRSKPFWEATDVLYPIPEEERIKNPNLGQNAGY